MTISGGWWHSKDLVNWRYVKPDVSPHQWPKEDMCAPAALSVGDNLCLFQSTYERRPLWVTTTPETGRLSHFNPLLPLMPGAAGLWDPAIFHDDDTDRWFMYFGSSNVYPIYGVELDYTQVSSSEKPEKEGLFCPYFYGYKDFTTFLLQNCFSFDLIPLSRSPKMRKTVLKPAWGAIYPGVRL